MLTTTLFACIKSLWVRLDSAHVSCDSNNVYIKIPSFWATQYPKQFKSPVLKKTKLFYFSVGSSLFRRQWIVTRAGPRAGSNLSFVKKLLLNSFRIANILFLIHLSSFVLGITQTSNQLSYTEFSSVLLIHLN